MDVWHSSVQAELQTKPFFLHAKTGLIVMNVWHPSVLAARFKECFRREIFKMLLFHPHFPGRICITRTALAQYRKHIGAHNI